jgi:hypothetical protein
VSPNRGALAGTLVSRLASLHLTQATDCVDSSRAANASLSRAHLHDVRSAPYALTSNGRRSLMHLEARLHGSSLPGAVGGLGIRLCRATREIAAEIPKSNSMVVSSM